MTDGPLVLGIETSCDETGIALVRGRTLLADAVASSVEEQARFDRMVELNVQEQVFDLMKTSIIQRAWKERGGPSLHGWVYRLSDGLVHTICEIPAGSPIDPIYRFDNLDQADR